MKIIFLMFFLPATVFVLEAQTLSKANIAESKRICAIRVLNPKNYQLKMNMDLQITKELLVGKFEPSTNTSFIQVPIPYANRKGLYLLKETYEAFLKMQEKAKSEGVTLTIISATRNFNYQKTIWEAKWQGKRLVNGLNLSNFKGSDREKAELILKYSSMPGTSRHHWGTDVDFNSVDGNYFDTKEGAKVYNWLLINAKDFGFCQPYIAFGEKRSSGYQEEKWHWSYLPLASKFLTDYKEQIDYSDIQGFLGDDQAKALNVIHDYVLGINCDCLP